MAAPPDDTTANLESRTSSDVPPSTNPQAPPFKRIGQSIFKIRKHLFEFVNNKLSKNIPLSDDEVNALRQIIRFCCRVHENAKPYIEHYQLIRAFRHVLRASQILPDYIPPSIHRLITSWERNEFNLGTDEIDSAEESSDEEMGSGDSSEEDDATVQSVVSKAPGSAMRGIFIRRPIHGSTVGRKSDILDKRFKRPANIFGHNGLTVGDWWPKQICALRDGAHGSMIGGIAGNKERGCYSIVVSSGAEYGDRDLGEIIYYTGSGGVGRDGIQPITNATQSLMTSQARNLPVRVIRTSKSDSEFAPSKGYRYDGLYKVISHGLMASAGGTQKWKFKLKRQDNQPPIRREVPTRAELATEG
jgi:hypothetical protein